MKNLHKDGVFYWVLANVPPSYDHNENIIGYYSVRRKPSADSIKIFSPLYQKMIAIEGQSSSTRSMDASTELLINALGGKEYNAFVIAA